MSRNASGTYTLPVGAFSTGQVIAAADHNSNYSDLATAMTQSLATTGVSTMTGPVVGTAGAVGSPSYSFSGDLTTGFWLAGSHQIGWAANGAQGATFNSDKSVTWAGNQSFGGTTTTTGAATFNGAVTHASTFTQTGAVTLNATTYTFGAGAAAGFWLGVATPVDVGTILDGGGSVILNTIKAPKIHIPYPMTITAWRVMADQAGSIVIDIQRAHDAIPSVSIVGGGNKPTLSGVGFNETTPSGWTATTLTTDDWISFNVSGTPSTVTQVSVVLTCTRTG